MPTNVYRIQCPDGTIPYQQYLIDKSNNKLDNISKALMKNVRCDGRDFLTHRKLCKDLNLINNYYRPRRPFAFCFDQIVPSMSVICFFLTRCFITFLA